ncbi:MAG: serine--tRNA ligase [Acidobacteriota bacterium]
MLDRKIFREDPDRVRTDLRRRRDEERVAQVDALVELDAELRRTQAERDELRQQANAASKAIGVAIQEAKKSGGDPQAVAAQAKAEAQALGERVSEADKQLRQLDERREDLELRFPNLLGADVPDGADESENEVLRSWGEAPAIAEPRAHDELGEALGIIDFKRAAKVSGSRFTFLRGAGARLEHALVRFMRDIHEEAGDVELLPPYIVLAESLKGTGQLPKFADDLFRVSGDAERYLIPTAEVPVTNYHADEVLDAAELPLRYFSYSPCFRSEAGSHGRDVRGYIRQHHFHKVEMVRVCTPEQSEEEHQLMTERAELVLQKLGLHHRVVVLCSGDTGEAAAKTHDIEVWLPSQEAFREISSCSNCTDYQARRAKIRYRPEPGAKPRTCHTLNGSGLAVGRTLVALLEQCQQADGSVAIPEVLQPYFGAESIQPAS